jgi:glycosyltransferase involved in cell wall biosynthesis
MMSKEVKVSIIIPMYNESRYIGRCLDSLKNQSYKDFEIILIDDGSKDNTIKIAEWYKKNFKLTILKQQHGWPGKARNRWAKEAKWDILMFVDADMYFDSKLIESLIQPILTWKEIWTSHGREYVWNIENPIARAYQSIRGHYDPNNNRSWIFRAILKSKFLERWWFDTNKWYTDDDLSKYGLSLHVPKAIIYHNNPEKLKEIFKHSIWVWSSLTKTWEIKNYIKKYMSWITIFFMFLIVSSIRLIYNWLW